MPERALELGRAQVREARSTGRALNERALRMQCAAYLATVKARLLTGVILDLKATKGSLAEGYSAKAEALQRAEERLHSEEEARERLQAQIIQTERMRAASALAGGIAHDLKNYLFVIAAGVDQATTAIADQATRAALADASGAARSAAELAERLLDLERPKAPQRRVTNLNAVVDRCTLLLRPSLPTSVELRSSLDPARPHADLDADQWLQALLNLGINAKDALAGKNGIISYSTGVTHVRTLPPAAPPTARPGGYAWVRVADNGSGMSPETLARVFEPFFTTKPAGKGTGLGLTLVYGCATAHDGWVEVTSKEGAGTSVQLLVPLAAPRAEASETRPAALQGTVLVIDDIDIGRRASERMIRRLGYEVASAASAEEALAIAASLGPGLLAVVTDLRMPGHDGYWLSRELRARGVTVPVVACSGSFTDAELDVEGFDAALPKPFSPETVRKLLEQVLARGTKRA